MIILSLNLCKKSNKETNISIIPLFKVYIEEL